MPLLPTTYFPNHEENRMSFEGDLVRARMRFIDERPNNLFFLLQQRYSWMNQYLQGQLKIYELGAGAGFSSFFIENRNLKLTDVSGQPWIEEYVNALQMPFRDGSVDVLVCSHMIHHLSSPMKFFKEAHRILKKDGLIVISDVYTSFLMRFLLYLMRHEGWSYDVNIFDENTVANDSRDPWSANCAIPELLFGSKEKFESELGGFHFLRWERTECLIFLLSGGVIAKVRTIPLPMWFLSLLNKVDKFLVWMLPKVFATGIRIVLQKR